ncbi:hypothetical protein VE03_10682 [Pseudogymnoascus sp. 23342-1-I1]|nr:hypothetical protein VE03_10682 [Pseudogymnoascus sp. 23342-1-I1]
MSNRTFRFSGGSPNEGVETKTKFKFSREEMAYLNAKLQQHMIYGTENIIVSVGHREKRFKAPNFTGMLRLPPFYVLKIED